MIEDETGSRIGNWNNWSPAPWNAVYDDEIYSRTNPGEITFAFISTCMSADYNNGYYDGLGVYNSFHPLNGDPYYNYPQGQIQGGNWARRSMPFAFTHRYVGFDMSSNGYSSPDAGSQVYIGFPIGSPSLTQWIPDPNSSGWLYGDWVLVFFNRLINYRMTVHDALDSACLFLWGVPFFASCLYQYGPTGFQPYWYVYGQSTVWPPCWMAVYGNANIQLPSPPTYTLTVTAQGCAELYDPYSGGTYIYYHYTISPPNVNIDGLDYGPVPVSTQVIPGQHTVTLSNPVWDPEFNCYAYLSYIYDSNLNWYQNGGSISVNYNSWIWGDYWVYY